jgi:hypothetical protein
MNGTPDARGALRDLLQFHFGRHSWLPLLFAAVAAGALVVLLREIISDKWFYGPVAPAFRTHLIYIALLCWMVSTLCAWAGGFVMGRLYVPRA